MIIVVIARLRRRNELSREGRRRLIQALRFERGWTVRQIAIELCVNPSAISDILRRLQAREPGLLRTELPTLRRPRVIHAVSLSDAFNA